MAEILKKLGDKVKGAASSLQTLPPSEGEAASIADKQRQVDALADQPVAPVKPIEHIQPITPIERVNPEGSPLTRYGSHTGEVRYVLDKDGNITPILTPMTPREAPQELQTIQPALEQKSGLKPIVPQSLSQPMPVYDKGGDVDVNDGDHQMAILQDGERVLTPEEAEQYKAEHPEKQEGAPADFGGRVISNPKGLKPILDTDAKPRVDEPRDAKMSTENAPLTPPKGDTSNATANGPEPVEASTSEKKLRPYSEVLDERAKQKAQETVSSPGAQTTTSQPSETQVQEQEVDEKAKPTLGQGLAKDWLKKIGASSVDELKAPKEFNQGTPEPGLKPIGGTDNSGGAPAPTAPAPSGKEAYHAKIAEYDKTYQDLMDRAAKENDPALREQAARVQEAKLSYQKSHPWGAKESAHPGVLGKIGHVAEQVASRLPVIGPVMATLPQSELGMNSQIESAQERVKESAGEEAARDTAQSKLDKEGKDWAPLAKPILNPSTGKYEAALYNKNDPKQIRFVGEAQPTASSGADKAQFMSTLKKIGSEAVADPSQQKNALKTAHDNKVIDDDEYKSSLAYLGSTANAPATQATASETKRTAGKTLYFPTANGGRRALTAAEAKAEGLDLSEGVAVNEGQESKDREKNSTYHVIQKSLGQYEKHIAESKITPTDISTMTTITEEAESPDYISKLLAGAFDALLGHPVTGYSEKLMKGTLTKNQWQDMSPAGRQLVADYYTTMMAHFANMKAAQGTIPRNPFIIQTEMHTIPKPYLNEEEAKPAFKNYLDQVAMRNVDNVDFTSVKGKKESTEPTTVAPPEGAESEVVKDGKVIGHVVVENGKKKYKALEQ